MREATCAEGHHLVDIWQASPYSPTLSLKQDSEACGGARLLPKLVLS